MKWDESFFDRLGHSPAAVQAVTQKANQAAAIARATAPVDTGAYRASIHVEMRSTAHRVIAVVVADAADAGIVESKTGNLVRAMNAVSGGR